MNLNVLRAHRFRAAAIGCLCFFFSVGAQQSTPLPKAFIDGAGRLRILWQIILPLSKPALATLGVFTFIREWNSFLWPLIATTSPDMRTLSVAIAAFAVGAVAARVAAQGSVVPTGPDPLAFLAHVRNARMLAADDLAARNLDAVTIGSAI